MPGNFNWRSGLERAWARIQRDPRALVRLVLGLLVAANVAAAVALWKPWGASPEQMERDLAALRRQIREREASLERLKTILGKVEKARNQGDEFIDQYFIPRRTASSIIIAELGEVAGRAGVKQAEHTFTFEPIEGAAELEMMTISGNYEGSYQNLVRFVNLLDRSPRLLIVDTLTAVPQRTAGMLNVNLKMNAFIINRAEQVEAERAKAGTESS
jgi:type IV pilus assembly protein PilO